MTNNVPTSEMQEWCDFYENTFNFKESSGLDLEALTFDVAFSDRKLVVDDLNFSLDRNNVKGNLAMNYSSISQLINSPEKTNINLNLPVINLNLNQLLKFQPALKKNIYVKELSKKLINGNLRAKGTLAKINISRIVGMGKASRSKTSDFVENARELHTWIKDELKKLEEEDT